MSERPTVGKVEQRTATVEVADKRIHGLIPYGVESRDLGGWREVIEPTAFRNAKLDELRAVIDHRGVPLARYPTTLDVEDRGDGLHWSVDPPKSRADVIEAIQRGDMRAGSWRMVVARDRWEGDVRHVEAIAELKDVAIVGAEEPAYGDAAPVEYRTSTGDERRQRGVEMDPQDSGATSVETTETETETTAETRTEQRSEEQAEERTERSAGSLRVEQRASAPRRGLADEFRSAGFPGEVAEIPWQAYEDRAVTWTPSIDLLNQVDRQAAPAPVDQRYAWTALQRSAVDSAATSVSVLVSFAAEAATGVVRDNVASTAAKAEVTSSIDLQTVPLKNVAAVESGIPNIVLEQPAVNTIIENNLRMTINEGLDSIVVATFAASGHRAPGTDPFLVSIRKAMTELYADGYAPDVLILTPSDSEALDVLVSGASGADNDYVFGAAQLGPSTVFGLRRIVSKAIPSSTVIDSRAYGKLYASPVRLATFEANDGLTNQSNVRLELNAACGVERQDAAIRIANS